MKYLPLLIFVLIGFLSPLNAQTDAISKYFDQYVNDERFTVVYISPKMFEILGKLDLDEMKDEEAQIIMDVVKELKGLRVLTTEQTPLKFYNEAVSKIKTSEFEILLTVRDEEENVQFLIKDEGDIINELLLLVGGEDEFVMLSFVGDIDLNKISQLAKKLDVKGVEHLDKLNENDIGNENNNN
jgi:Domain of unknown function (DUF4252)